MTPDPLSPTSVDFHLNPLSNHAEALFLREVAGRRLRHVARDRVPIRGWSATMLGELAALVEASDGRADGRTSLLLRHDPDQVTLVELYDGWANIATAGPRSDHAHAACRQVAETMRAPAPQDDALTAVSFWSLGTDGQPRSSRRELQTSAWEEIHANYGHTTQERMASLLTVTDTPAERLILWHGPPGTGKTHALRALARHWRDWCDVAYIADPERFLGGSPAYLFDVAKDSAGYRRSEADQRSKLVVLEDSGELMAVEARHEAGQSLSRLLNLTDGLIGQGFRVMVLITTNEPLSILHPAVVRPGRCLAEIEFSALDPVHATQWLRAHGASETVNAPATLADLYAILSGGRPLSIRRRSVGFAPAAAA